MFFALDFEPFFFYLVYVILVPTLKKISFPTSLDKGRFSSLASLLFGFGGLANLLLGWLDWEDISAEPMA